MAQNPPKTKEDFLKIKSVNEQKYKQFGEVFISAVQKALLSVEEAEKIDDPKKSLGTKKSYHQIQQICWIYYEIEKLTV